MIKKLLLLFVMALSGNSVIGQWMPTNGPSGGELTCIASYGTNFFAGSVGAGVFLSVDSGSSWTEVNIGITNFYIQALAISGTNIFAGTAGGGVFLSINNGSSWISVNTGLTNSYVQKLAVDGTTIYAGTNGGGMFKSTNNGGNWTAINTGLTAVSIHAIAIDGTNIFVGTSGGGVFKSINAGNNWNAVNTGLPNNCTVMSLAISGTNIFAALFSYGGLYMSSNYGGNWSTDTLGISNNFIRSLVVCGSNIFAGTDGKGVYISNITGGPWNQVNNGLLPPQRIYDLILVGSEIWAATNRGVVFSSNYGVYWSNISTGIGATDVCALSYFNGTIIAGTVRSGLFFSNDNGNIWTERVNGLPFATNYNANLQSIAVDGINIFVGIDTSVYFSSDNGFNWMQVDIGFQNTTSPTDFLISGNNVFACTYTGVYLTTNNGGLWTQMNNGLPINPNVSCIAICGSDIIIGTQNGAYISSNNGGLWSAINNGLTNTNVRDLSVIGTNVFAATNSGIYLTTNNGGLWTLVNTGLTNVQARCFAVSGANLFVATAGGIFLSTNNGGFWTSVNTGMISDNYAVSMVVSGQDLFAGTIYGGVWSRQLSQMITIPVWPGDANNNLIVDNFDLLPIGLCFAQTGIPRDSISNLWLGNSSIDWGQTQSNGANEKHVDCNGDSIISADDTLALNLNFSLAHTRMTNPKPKDNVRVLTSPNIYFVTSGGPFIAGDWVDIEVWLGDATTSVSDLYGFAFNIDYESSLVQAGTESITYPSSWLGTPGLDAIKISKIDALANTAYGAETRIDHNNSSGYGKIADFRFQISTTLLTHTFLNFSVSDYDAIDSAAAAQLFAVSPDSIEINPLTVVSEFSSGDEVNIAPNPISDNTIISFNVEQNNSHIEIINVFGENIKTLDFSGKQLSLGKGELSSGIYFIRIVDENNNSITCKILVQ